eukprot:TRINITY_DN11721_c0_g1_i1.p1 TRINITY_DN11721_c0_g1~~TRINITY_DN11721_c0_g1_i1.p1  ORF type:complete len:209 (+),score=61.92 TRINITY_DN11721_c0_g1_i1:173-799(+)
MCIRDRHTVVTLIFDGRELEEKRRLVSYGVQSGSEIHAVIRLETEDYPAKFASMARSALLRQISSLMDAGSLHENARLAIVEGISESNPRWVIDLETSSGDYLEFWGRNAKLLEVATCWRDGKCDRCLQQVSKFSTAALQQAQAMWFGNNDVKWLLIPSEASMHLLGLKLDQSRHGKWDTQEWCETKAGHLRMFETGVECEGTAALSR